MSKSTIYEHWSGGLAIAVEAYGARVTDAIRVTFTGDATRDLLDQVRRVAAIYAAPGGRIIAQIAGAGEAVKGGAELVRDGFFAERRAKSVQLVEQGVDEGLWQVDFNRELIIELLFGPIVFRALNGGPSAEPQRRRRARARGAARPVERVRCVRVRLDHVLVPDKP